MLCKRGFCQKFLIATDFNVGLPFKLFRPHEHKLRCIDDEQTNRLVSDPIRLWRRNFLHWLLRLRECQQSRSLSLWRAPLNSGDVRRRLIVQCFKQPAVGRGLTQAAEQGVKRELVRHWACGANRSTQPLDVDGQERAVARAGRAQIGPPPSNATPVLMPGRARPSHSAETAPTDVRFPPLSGVARTSVVRPRHGTTARFRSPANSPDHVAACCAPAPRWRRRWRCPARAPVPGRRVRPCRSVDNPAG
jgi:hypothetical protein